MPILSGRPTVGGLGKPRRIVGDERQQRDERRAWRPRFGTEPRQVALRQAQRQLKLPKWRPSLLKRNEPVCAITRRRAS